MLSARALYYKNVHWVLEVKRVLNYKSIGQIFTYEYLYSLKYPEKEIKLGIVCEAALKERLTFVRDME